MLIPFATVVLPCGIFTIFIFITSAEDAAEVLPCREGDFYRCFGLVPLVLVLCQYRGLGSWLDGDGC